MFHNIPQSNLLWVCIFVATWVAYIACPFVKHCQARQAAQTEYNPCKSTEIPIIFGPDRALL